MQLEYPVSDLSDLAADALIVGRYRDESLDPALAERLDEAALAPLEDSEGKTGDAVVTLYPRGALPVRRLLVVGLGKRDALTLEELRRGLARGIAAAARYDAVTVATTLASEPVEGTDAPTVARELAAIAPLTTYRYSMRRDEDEDESAEIERLLMVGLDGAGRDAARVGAAIAEGVRLARDLVNEPPNVADAARLMQVARDLGESSPHLETTIIRLDEAREMGMGAFAAVAQGSDRPAGVIVMEYRPQGVEGAPVALLGKGLTFDTGGVSLKRSADMWKMKSDLGGGAAVLGTFAALAALPEPLALPVVGIVPATDNAVGSRAFLPGDVLTALDGTRIEIISTDAEGRLILADALAYVARYEPRAVVDLATLTGAILVALGNNIAGLFASDDDLAARLEAAAAASGEEVWRLPLPDDYKRLLKSPVADLKNSGGRAASAITAALFLKHFAGDLPWAHLDIAGTAWGDNFKPRRPYSPKGASGFGVRLLMTLLAGYAEEEA